MNRFKKLFGPSLPVAIGMIHVNPLPGTPNYIAGSFDKLLEKAKYEAQLYLNEGIDGILIENMHDVPYTNRIVGPEIISAMAAVAHEVKIVTKTLPCGMQILSGCNKEALAVAKTASLDFIRAEGFLFSHIADEGFMDSDAGHLLRYRKIIDADDVMVFTDVRKKHSSHAITSDLEISNLCEAAEFFMSDGVIITGCSTGKPAEDVTVNEAVVSCDLPVLVGSGVTDTNLNFFQNAHGFIVGSYFKERGNWRNELSPPQIRKFMNVLKNYRNK